MLDTLAILRRQRIAATPQRLAVAEYVLAARTHPTADEVWAQVRKQCPTRLARHRLQHAQSPCTEGPVNDASGAGGHAGVRPARGCASPLVDVETGRIYDVPWEALKVSGRRPCAVFDVREYQVILRGRKRRA